MAIARALANEPRVVLADEPTGNLDTETGEEIIELLTALSSERRQTIVFVTHNPEIAKRAARVVRMQDGRLLAAVAPVGVASRPQMSSRAADAAFSRDRSTLRRRPEPGRHAGAGAAPSTTRGRESA